MTILQYLERKPGFVVACMYESSWGGYCYHKFIGYSKTAIVRELRKVGVVCPKEAYRTIY